jgi:hypothetical protein
VRRFTSAAAPGRVQCDKLVPGPTLEGRPAVGERRASCFYFPDESLRIDFMKTY